MAQIYGLIVLNRNVEFHVIALYFYIKEGIFKIALSWERRKEGFVFLMREGVLMMLLVVRKCFWSYKR